MSDPAFIPSKSFHDAANYVSTDPKLKSVSNDIKLEVHSLSFLGFDRRLTLDFFLFIGMMGLDAH